MASLSQHELLQQRLAEARAQIAALEQEHQDFRLQNDAEWRAKLDHLKAQIAAKDAALKEARRVLKTTISTRDFAYVLMTHCFEDIDAALETKE